MRSLWFRLRRRLAADRLSQAKRRWGLAASDGTYRALDAPSADGLLALIRAALPQHPVSSLEILEHGMDYIVAKGDGQWIFRFPRSEETARRLAHEAALLLFLRRRLSLPVPQLEICNAGALFSHHRMIPGEHLTPQHYIGLDETERDALAEALALFFHQMHALQPDILMALNSLSDQGWGDAEEILSNAEPLIPERLRGFLHTAIAHYERDEANRGERVIGHFDCHGKNMAFDRTTNRLNGVYDFGDAGLGNYHKEFQCLNSISRDLTDRVIGRYERLSGRRVNRRSVDFYTAVCSFAAIAYHVGDQPKMIARVLEWYELLQGLGMC